MKTTLFILLLLLTSNILISQETISWWNFQDVVSATETDQNMVASDVTISTGSIIFQNGNDDGGTKIGYAAGWSTEATFNKASKYLQFTVSPNINHQLLITSINLRFGRTSSGPQTIMVQYSLDGFDTDGITILNESVLSTSTGNLDAFVVNSNLPTNAILGNITFRVWGYNASGTGNLRFNNFKINGVVSQSGTNLVAPPSFSPAGGQFTESVSVAISSLNPDAEIYYSFTNQENSWVKYSNEINITETATIYAYVAKDEMNNSAVSTETYSFPIVIDNIAQLRAGETNGQYYTLNSEAIITHAATSRNQKYIQDETSAILIDDVSAIIPSSFNVYDKIYGVTGYLLNYFEMLQFVVVKSPNTPLSSNNAIAPIELTLNQLTTEHQAQLVIIKDVTFEETGNFTAATNYAIFDSTTEGLLRVAYSNADYVNSPIPQTKRDITGVILQYSEQIQIVPRSLHDFTSTVNSENVYSNAKPVINPNPITDYFTITSPYIIKKIELKDIYGRKHLSEFVNSYNKTLNISGLPAGVYIVYFIDSNGQTNISKLIKN